MQGERSLAKDNKSIGRFHLDGIPAAQRGVPQIEVTFDIDANGILNVSAKDKGTGKVQSIRIEASSGLSDDEVKRMKEEAQANAEADKKEKERIDKLNQADSMIFQTEKQLKDLGDKLPADKKAPIETALNKLKEAHKAQDIAGIDAAMKLGANHPMGPLELGDFIGLDICLAIMDVLYAETGDSKYRACPLLRKMVRGGNLGVKSGKGFYVYNADRTKTPVDAQ